MLLDASCEVQYVLEQVVSSSRDGLMVCTQQTVYTIGYPERKENAMLTLKAASTICMLQDKAVGETEQVVGDGWMW